MNYATAKKLHDEDEVIVKATGVAMQVIGDPEVEDKTVFVTLDDGNRYNHRQIK